MTPGQKSVLTDAPGEVRLTFSEPLKRRFTVIRVTGPAGAVVSAGAPEIDRGVARQPLVPLSRAGRYLVAFRTVSVDGHIVSGSREFTFRPAAGKTPAQAAPAVTQVAATTSRPETSSEPIGAQLALGAVAVALVSGTVLTVRRTRRRDG
ncbi:hypothetical protein GCM10010468_03790 [Actinocorallia longicatena]|uniref:CopC domain-containing protein n=2 Tax=Actinocorallia longicatena TaxID=111803 RepID=A0ABP6PX22_9ACTN